MSESLVLIGASSGLQVVLLLTACKRKRNSAGGNEPADTASGGRCKICQILIGCGVGLKHQNKSLSPGTP